MTNPILCPAYCPNQWYSSFQSMPHSLTRTQAISTSAPVHIVSEKGIMDAITYILLLMYPGLAYIASCLPVNMLRANLG